MLSLRRGESPRGQVLQRLRRGPGGHVRLVRPGQPAGQPVLRCLRAGADDPGPHRRTGTTPASPQSYTPRHLAEKILADRAGLDGERKQVTVLFADVVGSTELIRDRDPEDAQRAA